MTAADHIYLLLAQGTPYYNQFKVLILNEQEQSPADEYCAGIDLTSAISRYPEPAVLSKLVVKI